MVAAFTELHNNVQKTDVGFPALQFAFTWCGSTGNIGEKYRDKISEHTHLYHTTRFEQYLSQ